MWKCKKCETLNRDESCTVCGAHWTSGETIEAPNPQEQQVSAYPKQSYTYQENSYGAYERSERNGQRNNGLIITVVICVTVIIAMLLGIGAYMFVKRDRAAYPEQPSAVTEDVAPASTPAPTSTPVPTPEPTSEPTKNATGKEEKREAFLDRADSIAFTQEAEANSAMTQTEINQAARHAYEMWDALLNDVYQYLKKTLPSGEFKALKQAEVKWIKTKEAAMDAAEAEYQGGSMAPMARFSTGAAYTQERCFELIDMIK